MAAGLRNSRLGRRLGMAGTLLEIVELRGEVHGSPSVGPSVGDYKHRWRRPVFASASGQRDWPVAAWRRADRDAGWSLKL
jgi:hypothetical protein